MGLFDDLRCEYPLPEGAPVDGYQTKDTPQQYMELYEIRADGSLWERYREYRFEPNEAEEGMMRLVGCMKVVHEEWRTVPDFTGEVRFYNRDWEFSAYFVKGQLKHLETVSVPA